MAAENISCWNDTFSALETLTVHLKRILIQIKLCRNAGIQMDLSQNNCLSTEEAINYIPLAEKRKKVSVSETL